MTFSSGCFISPDTSLQLTFREHREVPATSLVMTDIDEFYSNYWQKQRSTNLESNANDLIKYFRTTPKSCNIQFNKKENKERKNKVVRGLGVEGFAHLGDEKILAS